MRLLVCGSREWPGAWEDIGVHMPESDVDATIIHGACSRRVTCGSTRNVEVSVDMLAEYAALGLGHDIERFPVVHAIDGPWPAAGPKRNARMLAEGKPDRGLAFGALWKLDFSLRGKARPLWRRTGTGDMVLRMMNAGLPVRWVATHDAVAVELVAMPEPPR